MRKYIAGKYRVKANEQRFNSINWIKTKLERLASFQQNDITVDSKDLDNLDELKCSIVADIEKVFEDTIEECTYEH